MVDWERVRELRNEVGAADFDEVVELFVEEVDDAMDALVPGQTGADDLHFLKGCALSLGFRAVSALCQTLETKTHSAPLTREDVDSLRDSYVRSRAEFLARAPSLSDAA